MKLSPVIHETVLAVAAAMEDGSFAHWVRPWAADSAVPRNHLTGQPYSGTNILLLWAAGMMGGYASNQWLTFKQKAELSARLEVELLIRKGEKGTVAIRWVDGMKKGYRQLEEGPKTLYFDSSGTPVSRFDATYQTMKAFRLFNVQQIEGWPENYVFGPKLRPLPDDELADRADFFAFEVGVKGYAEGQPAYSPSLDTISMPKHEAFRSGADYAATLYHELTHWTGHPTRCNRIGGGRDRGNFTKAYAFEELVAELGSAYLCAQHNIPGELQHYEYLGHWAQRLRETPSMLFDAGSKAQEACNWLVNRHAEAMAEKEAAA